MINFEQPTNEIESEPKSKLSQMIERLSGRYEGTKRMLACFLALTAYSAAEVQEVEAQINTTTPSVEHTIDEIKERDPEMSEWMSDMVEECQNLIENNGKAEVVFQTTECTVGANDTEEYYTGTTGENLPSAAERVSVRSEMRLEDRSNGSFDQASVFFSEFSVSTTENDSWENISTELPGDGFAYPTEEGAKMSALRTALYYIGAQTSKESRFATSNENDFSAEEDRSTRTQSTLSSAQEIQSYNIEIEEVTDENGNLVGYKAVSIEFTY